MRRTLSITNQPKRGLSLLELVVSMGLLALIMLPVISLLGTSYKVMNASNLRQGGGYARQAALDTIAMRMQGCTQILDARPTEIVVLKADGQKARLSFARGELAWESQAGVEPLITGLADVRFSVGGMAGAGPVAGELILVEVASRAPDEPQAAWSTTQIWIRPAI